MYEKDKINKKRVAAATKPLKYVLCGYTVAVVLPTSVPHYIKN
jgi:hypothetical protein